MITQEHRNFTTLIKNVVWNHIIDKLDFIEKATLDKVEINKKNKEWNLHITLPQVLPVAILKEFCSRTEEAYAPVAKLQWHFSYTQITSTEDSIASYWDEFIRPSLIKAHPCIQGIVTTIHYKKDHQLCIHTENELSKKTLESRNVCKSIDSLYKRFLSIPIKSSIQINSNVTSLNKFLKDKQLQEQSYIQQIIFERKQYADKKDVSDNLTPNQNPSLIIGKSIQDIESASINCISEGTEQFVVSGNAFAYDSRLLKSGKTLVSFNLTDETDSIKVKIFAKDNAQAEKLNIIKEHSSVKVRGIIQYDTYEKQIIMMARDISLITLPERKDQHHQKRIEFHLHTPMSSMDGVSSIQSLISTAAKWGHKAIAITDHGVVQAFPDAYELGTKHNIKVIYGVEAYLVNDGVPIVYNCSPQLLNADNTYIIFDTETTGLSAIENSITEIAAVKIKGNRVIGEFQSLVRPIDRIPEKIENLTGITNTMVAEAPSLETVMKKFLDFIDDSILVAHNASFDMNFINKGLQSLNQAPITNSVIDTVSLARYILPEQKSYRLNALCKVLDIELENHHRALFDAHATGKLFIKLLKKVVDQGITCLESLNEKVVHVDIQKLKSYHCILLAKNYTGLKNLYKLISLSHIKYFHRTPRIPKSELLKHREGLIVGSACEAGELYQALLLNTPEQEIESIASFYDYLEIQPIGNNDFMLKKGFVKTQQELQEHNIRIYKLGKKMDKLVVATGDVHFLNPKDARYREILMAGKGFADAADQPPLYLKTTKEMLDEFSYLGSDVANDVVINNPESINQQIEVLKPFPDELFTPVIEGAEDVVRNMSYNKARKIYGDELPALVEERLERELNSIIGNGFAVIYLISQKIVKKSLDDGYLVGSRGSVGSSFVATMTDITEVNPLPPHYVCPTCTYSLFITDGSIGSGFDLPNKDCPDCKEKMIKDGHDIPFETFMGFKGDKVPDIDLNFSGDYQPKVHKYVEELFGKEYVFRAGTISTVAEKTAYGFVQKYAEENNVVLRNAEVERLVKGCSGIKRTTGQHPGGQMVIPNYKEVYDFTPIQFPADAKDSEHYTTHFDYHAISGRLLKLDILGHDDPTVIRMLQDITGIEPKTIPIDDELTMSLFSSTDAISVSAKDINSPVATFAIPEFGTKFVRQMLEETRPTTFAELVRISGLSHGTDVWLNNAQQLIRDKRAVLAEVISTRDDIMVYLIHKGLEPSKAFKIMEKVRKGKGLIEEDEQEMRMHNVPDWYINSCKQIKYMFPKAHAVAYVLMAVRIAYFKVHHPLAFYATYFTVRADDFDIDIMMQGKEAIKAKIKEIQENGNFLTAKEKNLCTVLEVAYEMTLRGFVFHPIQLYHSDATKFLIQENGLLPPFSCLAGVGSTAAQGIAAAIEVGTILSIEDLQQKSKISKTVIELLKARGCLEDLPLTNQLRLF